MTTTREQLRALFALAATQGEAAGDLPDGLSALVRIAGERHQVVFRAPRPIGLVEAIRLRAEAGVPDRAAAVRYPPTAAGVHRLSVTWEAVAPAPTIFDLPPQPAAPAPKPKPAPARGRVWQLLETGEPLPGSLR
jgi:hypothetical protein